VFVWQGDTDSMIAQHGVTLSPRTFGISIWC